MERVSIDKPLIGIDSLLAPAPTAGSGAGEFRDFLRKADATTPPRESPSAADDATLSAKRHESPSTKDERRRDPSEEEEPAANADAPVASLATPPTPKANDETPPAKQTEAVTATRERSDRPVGEEGSPVRRRVTARRGNRGAEGNTPAPEKRPAIARTARHAPAGDDIAAAQGTDKSAAVAATKQAAATSSDGIELVSSIETPVAAAAVQVAVLSTDGVVADKSIVGTKSATKNEAVEGINAAAKLDSITSAASGASPADAVSDVAARASEQQLPSTTDVAPGRRGEGTRRGEGSWQRDVAAVSDADAPTINPLLDRSAAESSLDASTTIDTNDAEPAAVDRSTTAAAPTDPAKPASASQPLSTDRVIDAVRSPRGLATRTGASAEPAGAQHEVDRVRFIQRVTRAFQSLGNQEGELRLRLSPPSLGSLAIEVTLRGGEMVARLEAETSAARNLILDNLPALRERLAQHEVKIARFDVDLADHRGQGQSQQESFADSPQPRRDEPRRMASTTTTITTTRPHGRPTTASQLDVFM